MYIYMYVHMHQHKNLNGHICAYTHIHIYILQQRHFADANLRKAALTCLHNTRLPVCGLHQVCFSSDSDHYVEDFESFKTHELQKLYVD